MLTIQNKKVLLLGLGLHGGGVATVRWLRAQKALVRVSDLKTKEALAQSLIVLAPYTDITYTLGKHTKKDVDWADIVVVNPGVPRESEFVRYAEKKKKIVVNEASLFFDTTHCYTIAVTGTRGKSTTATYISSIIEKQHPRTVLAGNIRTTRMLDVVSRLTKDDVTVLELSSWQLEGFAVVSAAPQIAVVTNLFPDHLNRYTDVESYYTSKQAIFAHQKNEHALILNYDDARLKKWKTKTQSRVYFFSQKNHTQNGVFVQHNAVYFRDNKKVEKITTLSRIAVTGTHNIANALAAITASKVFGVTNGIIKKAVRKLPTLSGRQEIIHGKKGVLFVNDTTATTPIAGMAALARFSKEFPKSRIHVIAGGADKSLAYGEWAILAHKKAHTIYLLSGNASDKMSRALKNTTHEAHITNLTLLIKRLARDLKKGDIVLFSPSAASFNLWAHEFERGEAFMRAIRPYCV